ncbi:putative conserved membrane protein [Synechococcus sp. PROS-7-1]|nr:putative conserved membrane protein [Synechococcus sp. PROS-7-1]
MKFPRSSHKKHPSRKIPKQEQGLSMLIALMMGMVLMAGVTGLLLRQLMSRKLGGAESYQQMAETAALNGFNRILGELNNDDNTAYKGYLFTLDHHGGDIDSSGSEKWGWNASNQADFPLRELCTNRSQLPEAVPASASTGEPPHVALTESTSSQRDDGKANIQLHYRLRGYTTTATASNNGSGEGRFQIEGLVARNGDDPGKGYLARTLLLRSLYVNSIVAGEGDWAVLAGQTLSLGDTEILDKNGNTGEGKVLLNVNSADRYLTANGCLPSNLLEDVGASNTNDNLENRIVPIFEKGLPTSNLWNLGLTQDQASNSDKVRIWSFDDTNSLADCDAIACSRESTSADAVERGDLEESSGSVIRLSTSELCKGTGDDCHVFVEHINLTSTRLLIETSANRPVVLHLEYPGTSTVAPSEPGITGSINLGSGAQLCGVNAGSNTCNGKPEQLIILSAAPKPSGVRSCGVSPVSDKYVLAFDGDSLPAASVHLIPGIVKTGTSSTSLNGLIWADGVCTDAGPFDLITGTSGDSTVVRDLNEQWDWESQNFPGYGQMVTRGIRGTGLDTFRRW